MRVKKTAKKIIDVLMILMLPILAAEIQLGQESHEWLGIGLFVLFVLHHVMNYKWMAGVFKGAYSPVRAFVTALNLLLLLDFIALAYSGPKMSGFAVPWLHFKGSTQTARILHLFASEWSFILIPLHTGVHSGLHGIKAKGADSTDAAGVKEILVWLVRGLILAVSVFGAYAIIDLKIFDYLFLQTHFMFFDESKGLVLYFAEVVSMMVFFGIIGHLAVGLLKKLRVKDMGKKIAKIAAFLIPVIICLVVIFALNNDPADHGKGNSGQVFWGKAGQAQADTGSAQFLGR